MRWLAAERTAGTVEARWGQTHMHVPRGIYGRYLCETVQDLVERGRPAGVSVEYAYDTVVDVSPAADPASHALRVECERAGALDADHVVLCTGNSEPVPLPFEGSSAFYQAAPGRYVNNPWQHIDRLHEVIGNPDASVALIGSRLTAVDCLLTLKNAGHRGDIRVVSRTGRFPAANPGEELPDLVPPEEAVPMLCGDGAIGVLPPNDQLLAMRQDGSGAATVDTALVDKVFSHVEEETRRAQQRQADDEHAPPWQTYVDSLRPVFNRFWLAMPTAERVHFLTRWRGAWETRRHRMAPGLRGQIDELLASGQLQHRTGNLVGLRLVDAEDVGSSPIQVSVEGVEAFQADWVVNCSGPSLDCRRTALRRPEDPGHPLLDRLVARGLVAAEPSGICLLVDVASGRLLNAALHPSPHHCESLAS